MITINLSDFEEFKAKFAEVSRKMKQAPTLLKKRIGLFAEGEAKRMIRNQDGSWSPLNAKYLKYKTTKKKFGRNQSEKVYVATSSYFQSITSFVRGGNVFIGIPTGAKYPNGQSIALVAAVLEFGSVSKNIPPRPLWGQVSQRVRAESLRILNDLLRESLRN